MRSLQGFHMDTHGWSDIAYSFVVMPSGRVHRGRGWGVVGAHTRNFNSSSHAICLAGDFTSTPPTAAAVEAAAEIIRRGIRRGRITASPRIEGHRTARGNATSCPGDKLMGKLDEIRKGVSR